MLSENSLHIRRQECFQFKASFSPCTILQLFRYNLDEIEAQLIDLINRSPAFFLGAPVVIDLEKVKNVDNLNFVKLKQLLQAQHMVPYGTRNGSQQQHESASLAGLPLVNIGNTVNKKSNSTKSIEHMSPTKLVSYPIRSGMQVYAKNGDLIITSQVGAGAEIMADGHIHLYGTLRGRALAGVQGNTQARIYCRHLEAELISIAGYYLTKEDIQALPKHEGMLQIYLENEKIRIQPI